MPISDQFDDAMSGLNSPICGGFDITPDDGADIPTTTRAIMVSAGGDVAAVMKDGSSFTLPGLTPGVIYPVRVVRVMATGTTATGVKGLI